MIIIKKKKHLYIEYNLVLDIYYNCVVIYGIIYIKIISCKIMIIIKRLYGAILWGQRKFNKLNFVFIL